MNITQITASKRKDRNTWSYSFYVDGKRYRQSGFKTKTEALRKAHAKLDEIVNGTEIITEIRFKDYYLKWLEVNDKKSLSKGQYEWYKRSLRYFLEEVGENKLLKNITRSEYQLFLNKYGKGRAPKTVRKVHSCLRQVLRDATYEQYIKVDPTYNIEIRATEPAMKEEEKYLTEKQYLDLIEYFRNRTETSYVLLFMLAITGARYSEINNMTYKDLNHGLGTVHIPGTKTTGSDRVIELNYDDIDHVKNWYHNQPKKLNRKLFEVSNSAAMKSFKKALKDIGVTEHRRIYSLRHTHCSYLISKDIPIEYISKRLGHSSINMTLEVYSHVLDENKEKQGKKIRRLFS